MSSLEEKIKYLIFKFFQNLLVFLVNISSFFPKLAKIIYHGLFLPNKSCKFPPVYPSLQTEGIFPSYTYDFSLDLPLKIPDIKGKPDRPHDVIYEGSTFPQDPIASSNQIWYMPLHLPQTLHNFPEKHYKYLPKFDG